MPIDPYSPCPGGTGKKIKFCCSDLVGELDKLQRMLEGEQRAAALEHIESIESKYPDRACLLSIKSMLQAQLGQEEKAQATLAAFTNKYPENPVALAEKATLKVTTEGPLAAIPLLQDALEHSTDEILPQVYDTIGLVAQGLVASEQLLAGRGHVVLQLGMSGGKDRGPLELLLRLNHSPAIPLLAKQDLPLLPPPDDALWKTSFTTAVQPAFRGAWRSAAQQLFDLAGKVGDWPAIWHNIAVLHTWLAETGPAVAAWRKYAATAGVPLDDAVEAEALAQSLDPESVDLVDVVTVEYAVNDFEALQARLAASRRGVAMPVDLARMGGADEPPPKAAYWLLDRAVPDSGGELAIGDVPLVVGQVLLFGKQTDRNARLELSGYRTELDALKSAAVAIAGDSLGAAGQEEISGEAPAMQHALTLNWRLPDDTSLEKRQSLIAQQRREALLNRWPELPQKIFGGKTATQAASDPALKVPLLAAILLLEVAGEQLSSEFDFNELRKKLGLPELGAIDPRQADLKALPLLRMARIDVKQLTDEQLTDLFRRADHYRHVAALRNLAPEILARESLEKAVDKAEVYGLLAQIDPDSNKAVEYLDKARSLSEAAKKSTAPWDLAELALRIARGEMAESDRLLNHIREQHIREPGVAQALFQVLSDAGIIGPDGRPTAAAAAAAGAEGPGIVVPGAAGAEPGKIWTPGSDQPAAGKKSAIWTPGD